MERVVGIGGVFFRAKDPEALRAWYAEHLGIDVQDWGGAGFDGGTTVWSIFADDTEYFGPGWATDPEGNRFELWQPPPG